MNHSKRFSLLNFSLLAGALLSATTLAPISAQAQESDPLKYWLGAGGMFFEADEPNESGQLYEARVSYDLDQQFTTELGFGGAPFLEGNDYGAPSDREATYQGKNSTGENWALKTNLGLLYHLDSSPDKTWDPYLSMVGGVAFFGKARDDNNSWSPFGGPGMGVSYWFNKDFAVRGDYNVVVSEDHDAEINHHALLLAYYRFGGDSGRSNDANSNEPAGGPLGASSSLPLKPIYFNFDRSELTPESQETLKKNAEWIKANPGKKVSLEGHCDERGTNEYNMALGARRAQSAFEYLRNLGLPKDQLSTVSYGEEVPAVAEHNEAAWSKNRRVESVVPAK